MRINLVTTSLVLAAGIALSSIAVPANAATSCAAMFTKAEKMFAEKGSLDVSKKVKGYQMAIDGYQTCSKALAMSNGAARDTMMKKAEGEFDEVYNFILHSAE
jgi:azurin